MLESFDHKVHEMLRIDDEVNASTIDLRPGRSYLSKSVLEALGSNLADYYIEGGIDKARYSGGSQVADEVESLANDRLKKIFGAKEANCQPASPAQAIEAVLEGVLKPGDTVMTPEPGKGGHILFGHKATVLEKKYRFVLYGTDPETKSFNTKELKRLAKRSGPSLIAVCFFPYPLKHDLSFWRDLADEIGALLLVDLSYCAGLIPAGSIESPIKFADIVTGASNGLLRGPPGGFILCRQDLAESLRVALFPRLQIGASVNVIAAKAVAFKEAASPEFKDYCARSIETAFALSKTLTNRGFEIWSGGADYHYLIVNLRSSGMTGIEGETRLRKSGILATRCMIPFGDSCLNKGDALIFASHAITLKEQKNPDIDILTDKICSALK